MTSLQGTDTQTVPNLHDRELEQHLATLGLHTVEDYVQWCARHGFSVRVDKHWHQRCKERYFALQEDLKSRSTRLKHESRHPRAIILQIAEKNLAASDLTQPHFISISEALESLEGDTRDAYLRLLLHIEEHADLLHTEPVIRQLGEQPGNTFIDGLSSLAKHHASWLRPVKQWKRQSYNSRCQFHSLACHLLAKYPLPGFMDSVWFKGNTPEAEQQQQWFIRLGSGTSPRHLDLPVRLTHRMAHHFLRTPVDFTIAAACRRAQVLGLGGDINLAEAVLGSKLADDFDHEEFCASVIRWLIANPHLKQKQVAPVVDYVYQQRFASQPSDIPAASSAAGPAKLDFSIQGRTPESILRRMRQWHEDLRTQPIRTQVTWYECGINEFDWSEGSVASGDIRYWTIREILNRRDLHDEGSILRHCVTSYEGFCSTGRSAIWSLGIERNKSRRKRLLTVEVAVKRKAICQARGTANRMPTEKEMEILRRWAIQEGLTIGNTIRPS